MTKVIYPSNLPFPFAKAVRAGGFVFVSGQLPFGPDGVLVSGPIEVQTRQVLENIKAALAETGWALEDVWKKHVWPSKDRELMAFMKVYAEYSPRSPRARATVGAKLMLYAKLEIESLAYKPLPSK